MSRRDVWLPLTGKKCFAEGWQLIDFVGVDPDTHLGDLGLRLDNWIVVDCDTEEAMEAWRAHLGYGVGDKWDTWTRKTPHGYHFIYKRQGAWDVAPGKYPSIHLAIDVKAGMGHQIAYRVEGDERIALTSRETAVTFVPAWLPQRDQQEWGGDEWSEMPEGIGDNSMISFAGNFRRWGMDEATILRCLGAINEVTMTESPMPLKTLKRLARQAAKYNPEDAKTVLCPSCATEVEFR